MINDDTKLADMTVSEFREFFASQCKEVLKNECDLLCTYEQARLMIGVTKVNLYQLIHKGKLHPVKQMGNSSKFIRISELKIYLTDKTLYTKPISD